MGVEFKADDFNDIFDVAMRRVKNNGQETENQCVNDWKIRRR
jgi:hypothetical protein